MICGRIARRLKTRVMNCETAIAIMTPPRRSDGTAANNHVRIVWARLDASEILRDEH